MKKIKGFTLAEVLITLSILGVVAAITIPNFISNYKTSLLKTQLKQAYADLEQVSRMFAVLHNGIPMSQYDKTIDSSKECCQRAFDEIIDRQYIKTKSSKNSNNYYAIVNKIKNKYLNLKKTDVGTDQFDDGYFKDVKNRDWYADKNPNITIDINGVERGPNIWGIDLFTFSLNDNGEITPYNNSARCTKSSSSDRLNGQGCTKYALMDISPQDSSKTYWKDFLKSL